MTATETPVDETPVESVPGPTLDDVYAERAALLAVLALTHPAVLRPADDVAYEEDEPRWHLLVMYVDGQQASWHIAPHDLDLFPHVERVDADDPRGKWDGHTTDEKYERVGQLVAEAARRRASGAPAPVLRGRFSIYQTGDGGAHLAYWTEQHGEGHREFPARLVKLAMSGKMPKFLGG